MRVLVLMTITLASATTALLESVIRPVSDALVDWARTWISEHSPNRTARRATLRKAVIERIAQLPAKRTRDGETAPNSSAHITSKNRLRYKGVRELSRQSRFQ